MMGALVADIMAPTVKRRCSRLCRRVKNNGKLVAAGSRERVAGWMCQESRVATAWSKPSPHAVAERVIGGLKLSTSMTRQASMVPVVGAPASACSGGLQTGGDWAGR